MNQMKIKKLLQRIPFLKFSYLRIQLFIRKISKAKKSKFGFLFSGNKQMRIGKFEVLETKIISSLLSNYDVFIDIGANIGYYCCFALEKKYKQSLLNR